MADVVARADVSVIEFDVDRFERLVEQRPRLGLVVMRNLAHALTDKLTTDDR